VDDGTELKTFSLGGVIATSDGNVKEYLSAVAFSPDGKLLAVSSTTGLTFLISAETGDVVRKLQPGSK
jgi:WD40 repeat protein